MLGFSVPLWFHESLNGWYESWICIIVFSELNKKSRRENLTFSQIFFQTWNKDVEPLRRGQWEGLVVMQWPIRGEDDHDDGEWGRPGVPGGQSQCAHEAGHWPGEVTSWWPGDNWPLQAPAPSLTHHLVMSTKQQGHNHNSELRQRPFRDENVCFIQTTSFYIPISTWFPCLGPGHIQSCHSLLNADKLISITGTLLLLSPTLMLDFADIFRKQ